MGRHALPLLFILLAFSICLSVDARTASYWDSVTAIVNGENFYDLLQVSSSADLSEIKRGFRTVSKG